MARRSWLACGAEESVYWPAMVSMSLPDAVRRLLWDIDPEALGLAPHGDYLLERVMSRGGWAATCRMRTSAPVEQLAAFVRPRGHSLAVFADADGEPLPQPLTAPRWERVKADLRGWVQAP